jgi:Ca2+-binding EF-hand superfamily protein
MRWVLVIVGLLVVIGGVIVLGRSRGGSGAESPESTRAGAVPDAPANGGGPLPGELAPEERRALEELNAEIARAEPVAYRTDEQRLAEARAWVAANRPADRPYNELEAKILALMDVLADGDKRSAEWTMNMSQIEVEMIRAIDADGDGQVTDEEMQLFVDDEIGSMFNPMEHPYLQEKFDSDGDGVVSGEEMADFGSVMTDGALAGAIERGRLEAWDADDDGFISENERVAGQQAAYDKVDEMFAQFMPDQEAALSGLSEEQRAAAEAQIAEQMEAAKAQLDSTREMMASQMSAQELMEAMRLDNLASPDPAEMMESMPKPPDYTAFDADADGSMSEDETAAHADAMAMYQAEVERWGAEVTVLRLREQFEHATTQHDTDGNGRMSEGEWEARIDDLLDERDRRLFQRSYDLDGSGRVDAGELTRYLEWYRDGSLRADSNYDGAIDGLDLELVARSYQRQSR